MALLLGLALGVASAQPARPLSNLQFDLFPGYSGVMGEAAWFPATFELKNDAAPFGGTIELSPGTFGGGQNRRALVELPSGALKRVTIPAFCSSRYPANWGAQLFDERGRRRAEALNSLASQGQGRVVNWKARLLGALPRLASGTPTFPPPASKTPGQTDLQPVCARLQTALFPDNPIVLERLDALYLNSEKALDLKEPQIHALLAWLEAGGHLIVGVEQVSDVNTVPWLRAVFPIALNGNRTVAPRGELLNWLRQPMHSPADALVQELGPSANPQLLRRRYGTPSTPSPALAPGTPLPAAPPAPPANEDPQKNAPFANLAADAAFENAALPVATGKVKVQGGQVLVSADDTPLIVTGDVHRGRVTALLFSPEREPVRSWKHLPVLWARLLEVPPVLYTATQIPNAYEPGSDGIFGAMVDSRQVRKMPIAWLLLLLVVYLVVIGPLDRWWLKKIGRPMLTWVTFPCYVVLFSLLIYFIGYKLRAGESEWNELHLVDVFAQGGQAELRGRTYASVYSPANQRYALTNSAPVATLRGEFLGSYSQEKTELQVTQQGDTFKAEITVPVWVSQMCVSDWWQGAPLPLTLEVRGAGGDLAFTVQNLLQRPTTNACVVFGDTRYELGAIAGGERKVFRASQTKSEPLANWVLRVGGNFQAAVQQRQATFGERYGGRIDNAPEASVAASFLSLLASRGGNTRFVTPPGLDLTPLVGNGQAVLLAWMADYSPLQPLNQFTPRRTQRNTLWRIAAAVQP